MKQRGEVVKKKIKSKRGKKHRDQKLSQNINDSLKGKKFQNQNISPQPHPNNAQPIKIAQKTQPREPVPENSPLDFGKNPLTQEDIVEPLEDEHEEHPLNDPSLPSESDSESSGEEESSSLEEENFQIDLSKYSKFCIKGNTN